MRYRTLLADDEPLARQRLEHLLADFEQIEIVAQAGDGDETLNIIQQQNIDLVFLDIQMPGRTGLELLQELKNPPLIIFTTAYDQYALKAFEENAIDYLMKPIEEQRLAKAIAKLERIKGSTKHKLQAALESALKHLQPAAGRLAIKLGDRVLFLAYEDIYFFRSSDKLVYAHTVDSEYICDQTLNGLQKTLPPNQFVRAHRSALVNMAKIKEARRWFAGKYLLVMEDKKHTELPLARSQKHLFGF